jgi:hypothetical protein
MRFVPSRRDIVVWSASRSPAGRQIAPGRVRAGPAKRLRRRVHIGVLLAIIGLRRLARTLLLRWNLSAGVALTVAGVLLRRTELSGILLPGLLLLLSAPLIPVSADADRRRRAQLARELASYTTLAERSDLEATFDRYPDSETRELREILASQSAAAYGNTIPGCRNRR